MSNLLSERRRYNRHSARLILRYNSLLKAESETGIGHTFDISNEGIGIITSRYLSPDEEVEIELYDALSKSQISFNCRIIYCFPIKSRSYRSGLKLNSMSQTYKYFFRNKFPSISDH